MPTMNLSERLDAARANRSDNDPDDKFALQMIKGDDSYDGHSVQTGEQMTTRSWTGLRNQTRAAALPSWNPDRAHESSTQTWELDLTGTEAVIERVDTEVPGGGDTFQLPAWADGTQVYREVVGGARAGSAKAAGTPLCPTCDSVGDVVQLDLLDDTAQLKCRSCFLEWVETAKPYAPKGR
jgi:hypothetical protein